MSDVRADLGAGDGHAQWLRHLAHAQAKGFDRLAEGRVDGLYIPVSQCSEARTDFRQRRLRLLRQTPEKQD